MTLSELVEKAKTTTKKWWKWMLVVLLALILALAVWSHARLKKRIALLEAQKKGLDEKIKDLEVKVKNETNQVIIDMLNAEIAQLQKDMIIRQVDLDREKKAHSDEEKLINDVKTWQELEGKARGKK